MAEEQTLEERQAAARLANRQKRARSAAAGSRTGIKRLKAVATGAARGLTFDWADELYAGMLAPFSDLSYREIRNRIRSGMAEQEEKYPVETYTGMFGGGAAVGGPAVGSLGYVTAGARPLALLTGGAAAGTVAGAGAAEEIEDIPESAALGAGIGAGAGILAPAIIGGFRRGAEALVNTIRRLNPNVSDDFARQEVSRALLNSGYTPEELAARVDEFGPEAVLADIGGEETQQLLRVAANAPGARGGIMRNLRQRQLGARQQMVNEMRRAMGIGEDVPATEVAMRSQRRVNAREAYDAAYAVPVEMTQDLRALLNRPAVQDAYRQARRSAQNAGRDFPEIFLEDEAGNLTLNTEVIPDFQSLDFIKRRLDAQVRRVGRNVELGRGSEEYGDIRDLRNEFRRYLTDTNEAYADALEQYAGDSAMLDAMDAGRGVFDRNVNWRQVQADVQDLNPAELQSYRMGVIDEFENRMGNLPEGRDAARDFVTDNLQRKMDIILGEDAGEWFAGRVRGVQEARRTLTKAEGGSQTSRAETTERMLGEGFSTAQTLRTQGPAAAALRVVDRVFQRRPDIPPAVRQRLAELLMERDQSRIFGVLRQHARRTRNRQQADRWARGVTRSLMGGFTPSILDVVQNQ